MILYILLALALGASVYFFVKDTRLVSTVSNLIGIFAFNKNINQLQMNHINEVQKIQTHYANIKN